MVVFIIVSIVMAAGIAMFAHLAQNGFKEKEMTRRIQEVGIRTQGEIVGRITASQKKNVISPMESIMSGPGMEIYTEKEFSTNGLAIIEFDTEDGRRIRRRTKKPPKNPKATTLEVVYDPTNPPDCMIDGFYRIHPFYPITFIVIGGVGILGILLGWLYIAMFSDIAVL